EEAYYAEMGSYVTTNTDETQVYPAAAGYTPKSWSGAPSGFTTLGVNPPRAQLYCGYVAVSGAAGVAPALAAGQAIVGTTAPTVPWYYARSCCDFTPTSSSPSSCTNGSVYFTIFEISYADQTLREQNEGQ